MYYGEVSSERLNGDFGVDRNAVLYYKTEQDGTKRVWVARKQSRVIEWFKWNLLGWRQGTIEQSMSNVGEFVSRLNRNSQKKSAADGFYNFFEKKIVQKYADKEWQEDGRFCYVGNKCTEVMVKKLKDNLGLFLALSGKDWATTELEERQNFQTRDESDNETSSRVSDVPPRAERKNKPLSEKGSDKQFFAENRGLIANATRGGSLRTPSPVTPS